MAAKRTAAKRAPRRKARAATSPQRRRRWLWIFAALVLVSAVVRSWFLQAYTIPSRSMEDTLLLGDCVLVSKLQSSMPAAGDILVFESPDDPDRTIIKRCVAVAGQRIEVRNKVVFVDGERLSDPRLSKYLDARILPGSERDNLPGRTVPSGHVFVMGDNRDNSRDSRHWGFLSMEAVIGHPLRVYFSASPTDPDTDFGARLMSLPGRVRWHRIGAEIK